jgi:phage baseplate assembly protein V
MIDDQGVRIGEVSSIDPATARAKVVFDDRESQVSYDLPIAFGAASPSDGLYQMPDIGVQAVCVFLPNGQEEGYIVGFIYSDALAPPFDNPNIAGRRFGNGDYVYYDKGAGTLYIKAAAGVVIDGDVSVAGDVVAGKVSLRGHVHVNGGGAGNSGPPAGG